MSLKMIFTVLPALVVLLTPLAEGQAITPLMVVNLTTPGPDITVTSLDLSFAPGDQGSPPHTHSGPVVIYVVEGEFLQQLAGQPIKILKAGEASYEQDGAIHIWGGNASDKKACKVIATVYGRPGQEVLTFLKDYPRETYEEALSKAKQNQA